eukprot:Skav236204  [mRNA]  locus=scaffold4200:56238:57191:- [translate_table: standard]
MELSDFCLSLENSGGGRTMSNMGGFQSLNLPVSSHPGLCQLISLLRQPLCSFLFKTRKGAAPHTLQKCLDLAVGCQVEHLWINVNRPGHYNQLHEHGPALLSRAASAIYYPQQGDDTAVQASHPPPAKLRFYEGGRAFEIEPQSGLLVIFPTDLLHEVDPVWFGSPPRVSIALNLFVRWLDQPILQAAFLGDISAVQRELLKSAIDTSDPELNFQPIHLAAEAGHLRLVDFLINAGADPNALTLEGWCPLCLAAAQGHLHVVKYLQPSGAFMQKEKFLTQSVDLRRGFSGLEGALLVSSERGHSDIVEFLTQSDPMP